MRIKEHLKGSIALEQNIVRVVVQEIGQDTKHMMDTHGDHIYNAIDLFGYLDFIAVSERNYDDGISMKFTIEENPRWH